MLRSSCSQVSTTLAIQHGFWAIKYSRITVHNLAVAKPSYRRDFKLVIIMWSWTRWIENRVINDTRLWYNRVALLCFDGISNHLFCMWSLTRWTWNRVIKFTWLWYSRVVLLFTSPLHRSASNAILLIISRLAFPHF